MQSNLVKKEGKIRASVYVRVSSDEQVKGYSLSFQEDQIKETIEKDGAVLDTRHIFIDDGFTGINGDRPALKSMIACANQKEFDLILLPSFCVSVTSCSFFTNNEKD